MAGSRKDSAASMGPRDRVLTYNVAPCARPVSAIEEASREGSSAPAVPLEDIQLAALLISDAKYGRLSNFAEDPRSQRLYRLYNHKGLVWATYVVLALLHLHLLLEKPTVHGVQFPYWLALLIELIYLLCLAFRFSHSFAFSRRPVFWKDKKNWVVLIVLALTFADMIGYAIWVNVSGNEAEAYRMSRVLRPLLLINFPEMRQIRRAFRNIRRTLVDILPVLILFFFFVTLFALLGLKLFQRRNLTYPDGRPYFRDYLSALWDIFVLLTTANNPDVMQPAYDSNQFFSIFFASYMVITYFLIANILLAVVYNNYKRNLKNEVQKAVLVRRRLLARAFRLVAQPDSQGSLAVTHRTWNRLIAVCAPSYSRERCHVLFDVIRDESHGIHLRRFLRLADLLNVLIVEVHTTQLWCEAHLPNCYRSRMSRFIQSIVNHRFFRITFDGLIIVNAICIGVGFEDIEWVFLTLFLIEILLKLYVFGLKKFLKDKWNVFDFIIITAAFVATSIEEAAGQSQESEGYTIDILLVLRVLRLLKIIGGIQQFKLIITTVLNLAASFGLYVLVIWCFYYVFIVLGMELFQGRYDRKSPSCGNAALNNSEFVRLNYCSINFNDAISASVLLYHLLIVNQWHVITQGLVAVTSPWAELFTFAFMLVFKFVILNIVIAFIIEAFLLEFNLTKGELETEIEQKIKAMGTLVHEDGPEPFAAEESRSENGDANPQNKETSPTPACYIQFHLRTTSAKNVETLLQHMFEHELGIDDVGSDVDLNDLTDLENLEAGDEGQPEDMRPFAFV